MSLAVSAAMKERFHPRVEADLDIKVLTHGKLIRVKARDLSMAGLSLAPHPSLPLQRMTLAIALPGDREVVTEATVRRISADEVAVEFSSLDWEDMFALARFLHPRLP